MKVITVRQPWAWAIIHGGKDVENRSRNIVGDYRGGVAIHAGLGWSEDGAEDWEVRRAMRSDELGYPADDSETWAGESAYDGDPRFVHGAIIGTVNLWAVHRATPGNLCCPRGKGRWAMADHWHLCLNNPQPLAKPIPAKGRLGLWNYDGEVAS